MALAALARPFLLKIDPGGSTKRRVLCLAELTVCFESNFKEAALRKTAKYIDLVDQAKNNSYNATLLTLQVGSRGVPDYNSFAKLANLLSTCMSARDLNHLLHHVTSRHLVFQKQIRLT